MLGDTNISFLLGMAGQGAAGHGKARHGKAKQGGFPIPLKIGILNYNIYLYFPFKRYL